jgi:rubrerythrin
MAVIIAGSRTEKNLAAAYARESMSYNRHSYFANQAKKRGYHQIGSLFLETADNHLEHARLFLTELHGTGTAVPVKVSITAVRVKSTVENLRASEKAAIEDANVVYARYAEIATQEGFQAIARLFKEIGVIGLTHGERFHILAQQVDTETVLTRDRLVRWKCRKCGFVHEANKAPPECPACSASRCFFQQTEMLE